MIPATRTADHTQNRANNGLFLVNLDTFYIVKCHGIFTIRHVYHVRTFPDNDF